MTFKVIEGNFTIQPYQRFGAPRSNGRTHQGVDLCDGTSRKCLAAHTGAVEKRAYNSIAGYSVWLHHDNGTSAMYVHITKASYNTLKKGQVIRKGGYVCMSGRTGNPTAILLHYEYHVKGVPVDPLPYISETNMTDDIKRKVYDQKVNKEGRDDIAAKYTVHTIDQWWDGSGVEEYVRDYARQQEKLAVMEKELETFKQSEKLVQLYNILSDK